MMSMDAIRVHAEEGKEHGKIGGNVPLETNVAPLRQMTAYEQCKKVGVMLNPPLH
jgi:hypothetical protein